MKKKEMFVFIYYIYICCRDLDIILWEWWSCFKCYIGGIWILWGYGIWER